MRVAAIDVGTNTTRLLAAQSMSRGRGYRDLSRRLKFTRLGERIDVTGVLGDAAVRRTLDAIVEFSAECGALGIDRLRISATSAAREARNGEDFLEEASRLTGTTLEILDGESEAALSYQGAVLDLEPGNYLVCDIGGGSTEFFLGSPDSESAKVSLKIGSVRLTERFLKSDPPEPSELEELEELVNQELQAAAARLQGAETATLVGVAGTVTSLAAFLLKLTEYDAGKTHLSQIKSKQVQRIYRQLAATPIEERRKLPGLPEGRADVIVAGAAILVGVLRQWSFERVVVSERDILDGLVMELLRTAKEVQT